MKKARLIIILVLAAGLITGGLFLYFWWQDTQNFFTTDNASVSANYVTITPLVSGKVAVWNIAEGDTVKRGQLLGRQDLGTTLQNSDINAKSMDSTADISVSKAEIKTPIDGKIVSTNVVTGQTISPGMQVAIVADTENMFIKANVEETDIFRIKTGQKVEVTIDAWPDAKFTGYVQSIGQATQSAFSTMPSLNTSGTYTKVTQLIPVKINISNPDNLPLMLGMNATVKIHVR